MHGKVGKIYWQVWKQSIVQVATCFIKLEMIKQRWFGQWVHSQQGTTFKWFEVINKQEWMQEIKEPTRNNLFSRVNQVLQQHMLIKSLSKEIASGRVGANAPKGLEGFTIKSKGKSLVDNHSKGSWNLIEGNPIPRGPTTTRLSPFIKVNSKLGN